MRIFLKLAFRILLFLVLGTTISRAEQLPNGYVQEVKKFAALSQGKGNLLTPPRGSIDPQSAAARDFVKTLVEELAGPDIKSRGIHLIVNLYGSNDLNAWVQAYNPEDETGLEGKWLKDHPTEIWPIRSALGIADDKKPLYEIGITTGLLKNLSYKDELAFVLGHELAHLLEGHTSFSDSKKAWWSSQSHEMVADHLGLERMLGKYDLDAALDLMELLHPKKADEIIFNQVLSDGLSTHHAEGVRFAALQFEIFRLRSNLASAKPLRQTEIPSEFKLNVFGRQEPMNPYGSFTAQMHYFKLLEELLNGTYSKEKIYVDKVAWSDKKDLRDYLDRFENLINPKFETQSYARLLYETVQKIDGANVGKTIKLNTFIRAMVFVGGMTRHSHSSENWFAGLSAKELFQITQFLVRNSTGEGAWGFEDYRGVMAEVPFQARRYVEGRIISSPEGQKIFDRLIKLSPSWQNLLHYWTSVESFFHDGRFEMKYFSTLIENLSLPDFPISKLSTHYRQRIASDFSIPRDPRLLLSKVDPKGITEFRYLTQIHIDLDQTAELQDFRRHIIAARGPYLSEFHTMITQQLVALLRKDDKTRSDYFAVGEVLAGLDLGQMSGVDLKSIKEAYDIFTKQVTNLVSENDVVKSGFVASKEMELIAEMMKSKMALRSERLRYLRFLFSRISPEMFAISNEDSQDNQVFIATAQGLTKEELFFLHEYRSSFEETSWQGLNEMAKRFNADDYWTLIERISELKDKVEAKSLISKLQSFGKGAGINYDIQINLLQFLALYRQRDFGAYSQFTLADLNQLIRSMEIARRMYRFSPGFKHRVLPSMPPDAAKVVFDIYYRNIPTLSNFEQQVGTYERVIRVVGPAFMPSLEQGSRIKELFVAALEKMQLRNQFQWLKKDSLRKAVGGEFVGKTLARYVSEICKADRARLPIEVNRVLSQIPLRENWPDAFGVFRNSLAELASIQPFEIKTIFSEDPRSMTQRIESQSSLVRGMSAISSFTRSMPPGEQMEMIEFLMGRSSKVPVKLAETDRSLKRESNFNVTQLFRKLREELKFRTAVERTLVVNSILAGPNGLPATPEGLEVIHNHLLQSVSAQKREFAKILMKALAASERGNSSLILAYALSQKSDPTASIQGLSESLVLKSFIDFYGAPGVKLAQYLAFTGEFKEYEENLQAYQDAAMPISYYDALLLIVSRLGDKWDPSLHRVVRVIGSGSVKIAFEYENLSTGERKVVTLGREAIEIKTQDDFRRFKLLISELTKTEHLREKFGFLLGLMDIIEKSVSLEFDTKNSFVIQNGALDLYRRQVDGWQIQTVAAQAFEEMAMWMDKAPGVGARKVLKSDPANYEAAMRALMKVEYEILRGVDQTNNWNPLPLHANPDFHDGQVMIDVPNKMVTVLDFGQALKISNAERDFALDILRIISKAEKIDKAVSLIEFHAGTLQNKSVNLDRAEVEKALSRSERMDVFVYLLSAISRSGYEVPLATVHWVLAANRLVKLGEKVRLSPESSIRWMLGMRKIGLPLKVFNATKSMKDTVLDSTRVLPGKKGKGRFKAKTHSKGI